ncbi:MAG: hypothetical protein ACREMG_11280, partial [Gemmatimonadales bacterium]
HVQWKQSSLAWVHQQGKPTKVNPGGYYGANGRGEFPHPGYAWAMRRDAWDDLGGLIDWAVLGSGDSHMAHALLGQVDWTLNGLPSGSYAPEYQRPFYVWQSRAERYVRRNLGSMPGSILHHWHGPKAARRYQERPAILIRNQFDPAVDLKCDWQGLYQLTDLGTARSRRLRDDLRRYFHERNEDQL